MRGRWDELYREEPPLSLGVILGVVLVLIAGVGGFVLFGWWLILTIGPPALPLLAMLFVLILLAWNRPR